jgi:hypothetical protein
MDPIAITFDVDWAPDFVIEEISTILEEHNVRSTWFVTHKSKTLDRMRANPELFELGVHPNFLDGSTHGDSPDQILSHVLSVVPDAKSIRTHGLAQSGPLLAKIQSHGLINDLSIFMPGVSHLVPFEFRWNGGILVRMPYNWSDDYEMQKEHPDWTLEFVLKISGMKILNFHPMLLYLNLTDFGAYEKLKREAGDLGSIEKSLADKFINTGTGSKTFFLKLIEQMAESNSSSRIIDIAKCYSMEL